MKLLITGAAGFIGSNFVYYYLRKHKDVEIVALDNLTYAGNLNNLDKLTPEEKARFHFVKGDICDQEIVEQLFVEHDFHGVINFAAESHVDRSLYDPQIFLTPNILGTHTLLDAAKKHWNDDGTWKDGRRFIQISTDEVYGELGATGLFTETSQIQPRSPYSASKASADLLAHAYHETFGFPVCITRCSNNYGPYQFPEKLIPLIIKNARNHDSLPVYGDGLQVRDWIYVDDHCEAIDLVYQKGKLGEVYNIGGHGEKTNITVVKTIIKLVSEKCDDKDVNEDLIRYVKDRPGHDRRYAIDPTKIQNDLGWTPKVSFEEGLDSTVQWYIDNEAWIEKVVSGEYMRFYEQHYQDRKD